MSPRVAPLFTLFALFAGGCQYYVPDYTIRLKSVERPNPGAQTEVSTNVTATESVGGTRHAFSDSLVAVVWQLKPTAIQLELTNRSTNPIRIMWDQSRFVDSRNQSHRLIHNLVHPRDREAPQIPTVVAPADTYTGILFPADLIQWSEALYDWEYGYLDRAMWWPRNSSQEETSARVAANIGRTLQVVLPLQVEEGARQYSFRFFVENGRAKGRWD